MKVEVEDIVPDDEVSLRIEITEEPPEAAQGASLTQMKETGLPVAPDDAAMQDFIAALDDDADGQHAPHLAAQGQLAKLTFALLRRH